MIQYRSYYILQKQSGFLVLDSDKMPIDIQSTLAKAKHFVDVILDSVVASMTIEDVNELNNLSA